MRDDLKEIANKLGDRTGGVVMDGVREYNEGMPVYFAPTEDANRTGETRAAERAGRFVLEAFNEAGHNSVAIDVEDVLAWIAKHHPDMLIDAWTADQDAQKSLESTLQTLLSPENH